MSDQVSLLPNPSSGVVDEFGNGNISQGAAELFSLPSSLAAQTQSPWYLAQWGQSTAVNPADYVTRAASTYDDLYGDALYAWTQTGNASGFSIYSNPEALGGGDVYQISDGNTSLSPQGFTYESDEFLSASTVSSALGNLSHPITLTLNAKIVKSLTDYISAAEQQNYGASGLVFSVLDIGLTINFNGADGLPGYSGFLQIVPWNSDTTTKSSYETGPISTDPSQQSQFISSLLLGNDGTLSVLPSDSGASPDTLTYNINNYAYKIISDSFVNFSGSQNSALLDLSNWSIGGFYIGLATNDAFDTIGGGHTEEVASVTSSVQISDISLKTNLNAIYSPNTPVASTPLSDPNPQIAFSDSTVNATGEADGSNYAGPDQGIQYQYIYNGDDMVSLVAPANGNWRFGGGSTPIALSSSSGNNVLLASSASSWMTGGSGDNSFEIPDDNISGLQTWDTITDFHAGDSVSLAGLGGNGWTYTWLSSGGAFGFTGLTLHANSTKTPSLSELVTFSGLQLSDANHMSISPDASNGSLTIASMSTSSSPSLSYFDVNTSQHGSAQGVTNSELGNIDEAYIYNGSDAMSFTAPEGLTWEFGGGSGPLALAAMSGDNILIASSATSWLTGGAGDDTFYFPDANLSGKDVWDTITDFHPGNTAAFAGLGGSDWTYGWTPGLGTPGYTGLTLVADSKTKPGLLERITFAGLDPNDLALFTITNGTGLTAGSLLVSMTT